MTAPDGRGTFPSMATFDLAGVTVLVNPRSGGVDAPSEVAAALAELRGFTFLECPDPGAVEELAGEAAGEEGTEIVVAAGGDGTANAVVNGVVAATPEATAEERPTVAILPLGTGNDAARSLGIPLELDAAVATLARREIRPVDLLRIRGPVERLALNAAAGGFSGEVDEELDEETKRRWGPTAYLRSALEAVPDLRDYRTTLALDDGEPREVDAFSVVVANGRTIAGGIPVAPDARVDDGRLDVVVVRAAPLAEIAALVPRILVGEHADHDLVTLRRARSVRVESEPGMWFNADGELVGKDFTAVDVVPGAVQAVVGREEGRAW